MSINPGQDKNRHVASTRGMDKAWFGEGTGVDQTAIQVLSANGEFLPFPNANNDAYVPGPGISPGGIVYVPLPTPVTLNISANANMVNTRFFISDSYYRVAAIRFNYKTAGTVAGCTIQITKDTLAKGAANAGSQAAGTGTPLLAAAIDAVGSTVAKTQTMTLIPVGSAALFLSPGDSLSALFAGTTTTLAGVQITVDLVNTCNVTLAGNPVYQPPLQLPLGKTVPSNSTSIYTALNGEAGTQTMFIANRPMTVVGAYLTYGTAFAGGVTIDLTKDTGTNAPGAGSSILASAFGAAVVNPGLLIPPTGLNLTLNRLNLLAGDRIAIKYSATTTGTLVCLTLVFAPTYDGLEISLVLGKNAADCVSQYFFIAGRNYEVVDASTTYPVAGGAGALVQITIDQQANVPGSGFATDNTGFAMDATANTVQFFTPAPRHQRLMTVGDRLGLNPTVAVCPPLSCFTVSLRNRS